MFTCPGVHTLFVCEIVIVFLCDSNGAFCLGMLCHRYELLRYPMMCMGYRGWSDTAISMVVDISNGVGERDVKMSIDLTAATKPPVATWQLSACLID